MHSSISGISGKEVLDEHTLDSDLHAQASPQDDDIGTAKQLYRYLRKHADGKMKTWFENRKLRTLDTSKKGRTGCILIVQNGLKCGKD